MELRCAITAMPGWETLALNMMLGLRKKLESQHAAVRAIGLQQPEDHIGYRLKGFARPVDEYIGPHRVPGSDEVKAAARFAGKVVAVAMKRDEEKNA